MKASIKTSKEVCFELRIEKWDVEKTLAKKKRFNTHRAASLYEKHCIGSENVRTFVQHVTTAGSNLSNF